MPATLLQPKVPLPKGCNYRPYLRSVIKSVIAPHWITIFFCCVFTPPCAVCAVTVMTASPVHISPDALVHEALCLMEDRPSQIYVLPVLDPATTVCVGLIRLHDIYQARAVD